MHVAFVTAEGNQIRDEDVDRPFHEASFARHGIELEYRYWTDPTVEWSAYDLVVIRSPWDYTTRPTEFLEWLDRVAGLRQLQNPGALIRWNLDKGYLLELESRGVPVVRTVIARGIDEVVEALTAFGPTDVVIKPVVSAGSRLTGWFVPGDPSALDLAREILAEGVKVLVEPFISSVATVGEISAVFFDGVLSHCLRKGPILERGGGLIGGVYQENVSFHQPTNAELGVAQSALGASTEIARERGWLPEGAMPLYGRFDMVELDDGTVALIEAELFEPSLFLSLSPGAEDLFTEACARRAEMLR